MNTMKLGKYVAIIEFDQNDSIFHGEVVNLSDVVTFQGQSVSELEQAFRESVEDYLEACAEFGKAPEKPFTGHFQVRIPPEVHRSAVMLARIEGKSPNKWVSEKLEKAVSGELCVATAQ
jgi:predicted HicB family RNase H-like nuclease